MRRAASPTPPTRRSSPASCRRPPHLGPIRACSRWPSRAAAPPAGHRRVRRARHRLGACRARLPHALHRRRRLLQPADGPGTRAAGPVLGKPLASRLRRAGARLDRRAGRPRGRADRGPVLGAAPVPVRQRLGDPRPDPHYRPGASRESPETQEAALAHADGPWAHSSRPSGGGLPPSASSARITGTAFGEDGYHGHRLAHPSVWDVPYAEFILEGMR